MAQSDCSSSSKNIYRFFMVFLLFFLLLINFIPPVSPRAVFAEPPAALEITGEGVTTSLALTLEELEAMEQYEQIYSTINTWPTKRWYMARGVKLRDLLALAGIRDEATLLRFVGKDGYETDLTVKELLKDKRYYFPGLKENHPYDGSIPGSTAGAIVVEPLVSLVSAEDSDNPDDQDDRSGLMLVLGQRAVTEQTWLLYVWHLSRIEVLIEDLEKWDAPKVNLPDGIALPIGTELKLENKNTDSDKIYYTTDGSDPTVNSPMFNWSARRWWEQREDVESINIPLEIIKEMISKNYGGQDVVILRLRTIGPGKEDSEIATYTFLIDPDAPDPTKISGSMATGITLDRYVLNLSVGHTFQLDASVEPFNVLNKDVIWHSSDTSVATVDTGGLVTVVGAGTAIITAETADGNFTATCVINGPDGGEQEVPAVIQLEAAGLLPEEKNEPEDNLKNDEDTTDTIEHPAADIALPARTAGDVPPVPEDRGQYLAEKRDPAVSPEMDEGPAGQGEGESPRIFEMSLTPDGLIPISLPVQQTNSDFYTMIILLLFFLSGAGKRYLEYAKEL